MGEGRITTRSTLTKPRVVCSEKIGVGSGVGGINRFILSRFCRLTRSLFLEDSANFINSSRHK